MKTLSIILASALLAGAACDGGSSGGDSPGATGGSPSPSGGASADASGGHGAGPTTGGASSGGGASGGASSGSGGTTQPIGGAGGAALPGQNDPSCPEELPEDGATCFVYPNIVCSYEGAPALGENCICVALAWDCTGCPAEPIHGEMNCSGYEGEACGACSCTENSPNWDCGDIF